MRHRKIYIILPLILILVGGVIVGSNIWYSRALKPAQEGDETPHLVRIESGMTSAQIASLLKDEGLIRSPLALRTHLRLAGASGKIQIGLYRLNPSMSAQEITRKLSSGETAVRSVTITPGMRLSQIVEVLKQSGYEEADIEEALKANYPYSVLKDKPAGASLEGYLYPDTYVVELDTPVTQLVDLILSVTDERVTEEIRKGWADQGLNIHEGLILASIVEKEDSVSDRQPTIAQVFLKRLAIGMKLEADPTFEYAAELLGVTASTTVDSPYNTYVHEGLPPTPIASAELSAMKAVADPADTDWLYFLHDKQGNAYFSDNLEKHKQNIERYLR